MISTSSKISSRDVKSVLVDEHRNETQKKEKRVAAGLSVHHNILEIHEGI